MPAKRLLAAFLLSFLIHALAILLPGPGAVPRRGTPAALEARLRPSPETPAAQAVPPKPEAAVESPPPREKAKADKRQVEKAQPSPRKPVQAPPRFQEPASFNGYPLLQGSAAQAAFSQLGRQPPYPAEAIAQGLEGEVLVLLFLDAAGNVMAARVERGSGHALLDQAAVTAARRLKALPEGAPREAVLPVRFRLH